VEEGGGFDLPFLFSLSLLLSSFLSVPVPLAKLDCQISFLGLSAPVVFGGENNGHEQTLPSRFPF